MSAVAEIRKPTEENLLFAASLLRQGQLVAFPTETVYGLGANALDDSAVLEIFKAKNRPSNNPLIVHLAKFEDISKVAEISDPKIQSRLERLKDFWPGPLSVVLPSRKNVSSLVRAGGASVAVRIPAHPVALQLLSHVNLPIAAPSANQSGYVSPTTASHVLDSLGSKIRLILDGGACGVGLESTVISLVTNPPTLLRPGAITHSELESALHEVVTKREIPASVGSQSPLQSPGLLSQHYATATPIDMIDDNLIDSLNNAAVPIGLILIRPRPKLQTGRNLIVRCLSDFGDLTQAATHLFAAMRELDQLQVKLIYVERCNEEGIGEAIMDRLRRATFRNGDS